MTMTVVFEDYEDMMNFAKKVMGQAVSSDNASQRPTAESILGITPETFHPAGPATCPCGSAGPAACLRSHSNPSGSACGHYHAKLHAG